MKKIICVLVIVTFFVDAKQMRSIKDVETLLKYPSAMVPAAHVDQKVIKQRLDEQLQVPVETAWDDRINDLFDLAMVNRELARQYFIQMREKMVVTDVKPIEVVLEKNATEKKEEAKKIEPTKGAEEKLTETMLPAGEEPMQKAAGRSAPPRKPGAPKVEPTEAPKTEEVSTDEPMQQAPTKKGPPPGGPKSKIGSSPKSTASAKKPEESVVKGPAPLSVTETYSAARLDKALTSELLTLFEDLLKALGTIGKFWDGTVVPQKPVLDWDNKINSVKKALMKRPGIKINYDTVIADRIKEVREIKKQEALTRMSEREKQGPSNVSSGQDVTEE